MIYYSKGKTGNSYVIPDGVTHIDKGVFSHCTNLSSVTIPKNVTMIGNSAFYSCTGFTSITIPENVASIGVGTLSACHNLRTIVSLNPIPPNCEYEIIVFLGIPSTCTLKALFPATKRLMGGKDLKIL